MARAKKESEITDIYLCPPDDERFHFKVVYIMDLNVHVLHFGPQIITKEYCENFMLTYTKTTPESPRWWERYILFNGGTIHENFSKLKHILNDPTLIVKVSDEIIERSQAPQGARSHRARSPQ